MYLRNVLAISVCSALLISCGSASNVRETLGLNRKAPDEFKVYARPALTVPPEFSLRAPGSETDAPTAVPANQQARSAVLGTAETNPDSLKVDTSVGKVTSGKLQASPQSNADAQFLQKAGAANANPDVRKSITQDAENGLVVKDDNYLISGTTETEPTVDAIKEAERIKQNKAENKSPAEGESAVTKPKSKGILGTIGDLF